MIPFDRLNSFIQNPSYVPLIGEMMPSRWAYEAMAVHQVKGNRFSREFFEIEQVRQNSIYMIDYVDVLQQKLNDLNFAKQEGQDLRNYSDDLVLLRDELSDLASTNIVSSFGSIENLWPERFNEAVFKTVSDSLGQIQDHFRIRRMNADRHKDAKVNDLIRKWGGNESFVRMKKEYTNKRMEAMLYNRGQLFVEWNNRMVRKTTPIFMEPVSRTGRAHFYAPVKKLGNLSLNTFWFNLIFIWITSLVFYMFLVFDLLRKFTNWNRIRKLRHS
jgi:hypothetical protein